MIKLEKPHYKFRLIQHPLTLCIDFDDSQGIVRTIRTRLPNLSNLIYKYGDLHEAAEDALNGKLTLKDGNE